MAESFSVYSHSHREQLRQQLPHALWFLGSQSVSKWMSVDVWLFSAREQGGKALLNTVWTHHNCDLDHPDVHCKKWDWATEVRLNPQGLGSWSESHGNSRGESCSPLHNENMVGGLLWRSLSVSHAKVCEAAITLDSDSAWDNRNAPAFSIQASK